MCSVVLIMLGTDLFANKNLTFSFQLLSGGKIITEPSKLIHCKLKNSNASFRFCATCGDTFPPFSCFLPCACPEAVVCETTSCCKSQPWCCCGWPLWAWAVFPGKWLIIWGSMETATCKLHHCWKILALTQRRE